MSEKHNVSCNRLNRDEQNKSKKSNNLQSNPECGVISRERSFVRTSNQQQNLHKRRSLALLPTSPNQTVNARVKPTVDIYRPPKITHNLQHSVSSSIVFPMLSMGGLNRQHTQFSMPGRRIAQSSHQELESSAKMPQIVTSFNKPGRNTLVQSSYVNSSNNFKGNVPNISNNRVKFSAEINEQLTEPNINQNACNQYVNNVELTIASANALKRSKSLSSADTLTRGFASLGLGLGREVNGIGEFTPEVQALINIALDNPNNLNSRYLIELTTQFIKRAVENRRYALPISKLCLNIIAKCGETKETFLEALLNTCRQWYQEREKLLFMIHGMQSLSRARFTAFMVFLTEMFCQLKRRQLQMKSKFEGASPPLVLLTLLSKCCEECVAPPVLSLSEIECLFYVLTCIGQDMEMHLPQQLEGLMLRARDAFLNASDAAPTIRRTLLQLIELKASHWQLSGNTVLYYYPTTK